MGLLTCYIKEDSVLHNRNVAPSVIGCTPKFILIHVFLCLETDSADQFLSIPISCSVRVCHVYVILAKYVTTWIKITEQYTLKFKTYSTSILSITIDLLYIK